VDATVVRNISRHHRRSNETEHTEDEQLEHGQASLAPLPGNPLILTREEHCISRKSIDPDAIKVMSRLIRHGHRAFLVGGGVRDLLLEKKPKDFDIGTDARPEVIRSLFRNSRVIGRRFRINHIFFGGNKIFEVSTFRANVESEAVSDGLPIRSDNTYGDPETDALRRDLTINGLFYDLSTFSVIDYVGGIADLRNGIIRVIGQPDARFREDPVRMIRAIRHAARTGFTIEEETFAAICRNKELIRLCSGARVFEELMRELSGGHCRASLQLLEQTGLLPYLLPPVSEIRNSTDPEQRNVLDRTLARLDAAVASGREVPLAVVFLSLFVGNLPLSLRETPKIEESWQDIRPFWLLSPWDDASGEEEGEGDSVPVPLRGSVRIRATVLDRVVEALFKPLGVPRKDRERMSGILACRYTLIALYQDGGDTRSIVSKAVFPDALLLLQLTADNDMLRDCAEYWSDRAGSARPKRNQPARRRRRPRR
jgi:poly(A) polymerase